MVRSPGGAEPAGAAPTCRRRKRAANRRGSRELLRLELFDLAGARRHHAQRPRHGGGGAGAEARSDGAAEPAHLQEHDGEQVAFARESARLSAAHQNEQLRSLWVRRTTEGMPSHASYAESTEFISACFDAVRWGLQRAAHLLAVYRPERRSKILRGRCGGSPRLGARGGVGGRIA